jgi:hypothetical protein
MATASHHFAESKAGKNRLHLDIKVAPGLVGEARRAKLSEEADRLTTLGAKLFRVVDEPDGFHLIMHDPEGNEFCVA